MIEENLIDNNAVAVGRAAPNFILHDAGGREWSLGEQLGSVAVLLFYPKNETLVCTKQLCSIRDNWQHYLETKAVVVGVSEATGEEHSEFAAKHRLPMPLLVDHGRAVTKQFAQHAIFPVSLTRGVVVVDAKGIVRSREVMLRAFRPKDAFVLASIYAARGDAFSEKYEQLRKRLKKTSFD